MLKWKPLPGRIQILADDDGVVWEKIVTEYSRLHRLVSTGKVYMDVYSAQSAGEKRQRELFNNRIA